MNIVKFCKIIIEEIWEHLITKFKHKFCEFCLAWNQTFEKLLPQSINKPNCYFAILQHAGAVFSRYNTISNAINQWHYLAF